MREIYSYMKSGIYTITNTIDGKMYVGRATYLTGRLSTHKSNLLNNKHQNIHLQRAWNKYGAESFLFEVLVECEKEHLASEEHYWCNLLNVHNDIYGYNIEPTSPKNIIKRSPETIEKMKNRKYTDEQREEMRKRMLGRKVSEETRQKMSQAGKKRIWTEETRKKISEANKGRKHSDEMRKKCSERLKGKPGFMTGRKFTPEQLKRLSEAHKGQKPTNIGVHIGIKRAIVQYALSGEYIRDWDSMIEAGKEIGKSRCYIWEICNGKNKKNAPYIYKYK